MAKRSTRVYHGGPANTSSGGAGFNLMTKLFGLTGTILLQSVAGDIIDAPVDLNINCDAGCNFGLNSWLSMAVIGTTFVLLVGDADIQIGNCTITIGAGSRFKISGVKSGATQVAAGAQANEIWRTQAHASLPNGVLMIGL